MPLEKVACPTVQAATLCRFKLQRTASSGKNLIYNIVTVGAPRAGSCSRKLAPGRFTVKLFTCADRNCSRTSRRKSAVSPDEKTRSHKRGASRHIHAHALSIFAYEKRARVPVVGEFGLLILSTVSPPRKKCAHTHEGALGWSETLPADVFEKLAQSDYSEGRDKRLCPMYRRPRELTI